MKIYIFLLQVCGITNHHEGGEDDLIHCFKLPELEGAREQFQAARARDIEEVEWRPLPEPEEFAVEDYPLDDDLLMDLNELDIGEEIVL